MASFGSGAIIAVGGGEDKTEDMLVLRRALGHAPGARRVAILPTASSDPLWAAELHVLAFRALGVEVDVVDVRARDAADAPAHVERIQQADLVYMTGGDQSRLRDALAGSAVLGALREKLAAGGVVAGTSAGAAAMSAVMIEQGDARLRKGDVRLADGLGLLPSLIVDTHFAERGRFGRLLEAIATHPSLVGIGLGEDTAIVVRGDEVEVVGRGSVVVIDGREMRSTNVAHAEEAQPVSFERIVMHTYTDGSCFRLAPSDAPLAGGRSPARA